MSGSRSEDRGILREVEAIKERANGLCHRRLEEAAASRPLAVIAPLPRPTQEWGPIVDIETYEREEVFL